MNCRLYYLFFIVFFVLGFKNSLNGQSRYGKLLPTNYVYSTTSKSNTLYTGIDNRLALSEKLTSTYDSLILKTNNGKLLFDSSYFVLPRRSGKLRVEVHSYSNAKIDTVGYLNFKVLPLPRPKIAINNQIIADSMLVSTETFMRGDSILIAISDDIIGSSNWIEVKEFSIGYNYGAYFIEESSKSNKISDEMKSLVYKKGAGRMFSVKVISQSASSMRNTNPMFKIMFY